MVQITPETPFADITVQGLTFQYPMPFSEGHTLDVGEASQLNQVLGENLRNNFASVIKEARKKAAETNGIEEDEVTAEHLDIEDLAEQFRKSAEEYKFGVRRGGIRGPTDPVEREALSIAKDKVRQKIKEKGITLSDIPKEKIQELAEQLIERNPEITEEARRRVEASRAISIEELTI